MSKLLSKFKRNAIDGFIDSLTEAKVSSISVANSGSGYTNGEVIGLIGGTTVDVTETSNTGAVVSIETLTQGIYDSTDMSIDVKPSNGAGTGLLFNISYEDLNRYYVFTSKTTEYPTSDVSAEVETEESSYEAWSEMLFGKTPTFAKMTERYNWANNTLYAQYDSQEEMKGENFFVITDTRDVFKCIYNNLSVNSTVKPVKNASELGKPFQTADGYEWFYLYTIPKLDFNRFATTSYIPVIENSLVTDAAIDGALFNVRVDDIGSDYPNNSGTIQTATSNTVFQLASTASANVNYYANSSVAVTDTSGTTYVRPIVSSNSSKYVTTTAFPTGFLNTSCTYVVGPKVTFSSQTGSGAVAYAIVDENDGRLTKVQMVEYGTGYREDTSVSITAGAGLGSGAIASPIISPKGGHGGNVYDELYVDALGVHCLFDEPGLPNVFNTDVTYRTVGLLKNPKNISDVLYSSNTFNQISTINITSSSGVFEKGEVISGGTSGAYGRYSFSNASIMSMTGIVGTFQNGEILTGASSNATATTTSTASSVDLKTYSGEILYVQNLQPIVRSASAQEQIKLVIRF
jgi:hypothetical protein